MLSPLSSPTYRRLFSAQVIALVGTGLTTVALSLLAYDLAEGNAGAVLGTALAIKMVAYVGVSPLAGSVAQRLPRRATLVSLDLVRAGGVACLPFVGEVWQVYALIFVLNAASAGFTPTFQATIPDILPDEGRYTRALSLSRLAYDLENLLSPALAGALIALTSYHWLFVGNAAGFIVSALLVLSVTLPTPSRGLETPGVLEGTVAGLRSYLATPRLRGLLSLNLAVAAGSAMVIVNTVVYVRETLERGETAVAVALAASGAGAMAAALALPRLLEKVSDRPAMLGGGSLIGAGLLAGLVSPGFAAFLALWFAVGVGLSLVQTPTGRLLRRSAAPEHRPALFSAQFSLSHACWLLTYPLAGWIGSAYGLSVAFVVLAGLAAASVLAAALLWPARDPEILTHGHAAVEHEHLHVHDEHHQHEHVGDEIFEPHFHPHRHGGPLRHRHAFSINNHHRRWPMSGETP